MGFKRVRIPITSLTGKVDPLSGRLWGCAPISASEIITAVEQGALEPRPWDEVKDDLQGPAGRSFHIRRIATFVRNGLPSDDHAIVLDLQPQPDGLPIGVQNGNHRLAAALFRGDAHVDALVFVFDQADLDHELPGWTEL
jgi:hypothetical protein